MRRLVFALVAAAGLAGGAQAADLIVSDATHIAIVDYKTGQVIYEKNARIPMPPASMSKLMTAYMTFDKLKSGSLKLDDTLPVSETAWRMQGSKMFVAINSQVKVEDLIRGMIIQSGNDACITLAEGIAGTEAAFADAMNRKAREIGLLNSTFANSTGWPDPNQRMSARDLGVLGNRIIRDFPQYYKYYGEPSFTYNGISQGNRNPLLGRFAGADGIKTGHTDESGYGLVGSAVRNGERRVIVFNGMTSMDARASEAQRLMLSAFADFRFIPLYKKGAVVSTIKVFGGNRATVDLVAPADIRFGLHRAARAGMKVEVVYKGPLAAPFKAGDTIAVLRVTAPGRGAQDFPLAAATDVRKAGPFGRIIAGAARLFGGGR